MMNGRDHALPDDVQVLAEDGPGPSSRARARVRAHGSPRCRCRRRSRLCGPCDDRSPGSSVALAGGAIGLTALLFDAAPLFVPAVAFVVLGFAAPVLVWVSARGASVERRIEQERVIEDDPLEAWLELRGGPLGLPGGEVCDPLSRAVRAGPARPAGEHQGARAVRAPRAPAARHRRRCGCVIRSSWPNAGARAPLPRKTCSCSLAPSGSAGPRREPLRRSRPFVPGPSRPAGGGRGGRPAAVPARDARVKNSLARAGPRRRTARAAPAGRRRGDGFGRAGRAWCAGRGAPRCGGPCGRVADDRTRSRGWLPAAAPRIPPGTDNRDRPRGLAGGPCPAGADRGTVPMCARRRRRRSEARSAPSST